MPPGADPLGGGNGDRLRYRELRIHGVGGSPGAELVGYPSRDDAAVVGEGVGGTVFLARRADPSVEGYNWGDLTTGSGTQPLWLVLLPFTLLNVAGWAHPPAGVHPGRVRVLRGLVHVLSLALTAIYVFGAALLFVDLLGYQWAGRLGCPQGSCRGLVTDQRWGVPAGLVVTALTALVLALIAGGTQHGFERVKPHRRLHVPADRPWGVDERLDSAQFFNHATSASKRLWLHLVVMGASLVSVGVLSVIRLGQGRPSLGVVQLLDVPAAVALVGLLALWLLCLACWAAPGKGQRRRWCLGPAVAATLGFGLLNAVYSGSMLLILKRVNAWPARSGPGIAPGPELALVDLWGGFTVAAALAALAGYAWFKARKPGGDTTDVGDRTSDAGFRLDGADPAWCKAIGSARSLAWVAHRPQVPATLLAAGMIGTYTVFFLDRRNGLGFAMPHSNTNGAFWRIGAYLLPALALATFQLIRKAQGGNRTFVATIWDVLTFWPRRFSPLAVRPYAERAVPEFQGRLYGLLWEEADGKPVTTGRNVVVSAHSQGTIIAFASLAPLTAEQLDRVAFVTYGCPLNGLYETFFPGYCGPGDREALRGKLPSPKGAGLTGWRNYWRRTDPIGGPVLPDRAHPVPLDVELPDPCPSGPMLEPASEGEPPLERDRDVWSQIAGHSLYLREPVLKAWVARLRAAALA